MNAWPILAALVLTLGAGGFGYIKGGAANEAVHVAELAAERLATLKQADLTAEVEARRLVEVEANRMLTQALEDQGNADPVAVPECLSAGRVRRIFQ